MSLFSSSLDTPVPYRSELSSELLAQYQSALNMTSIVSITDRKGRITYVNRLFEDISGYSKSELIGQDHSLIRHPDMPASVFESLWKTIKRKQIWTGLIKNQRKDGRSYYVKTSIIPIIDASGGVKEFLSIRNDVTNIIKARQTIRQQTRDPLTGLPNRSVLMRDTRNDNVQLVAIVDVQNFKMMNDYWGVDAGNQIIQQIADKLNQLARPLDIGTYAMNGAMFALRPLKDRDVNVFHQQCRELEYQLSTHPVSLHEHPIDIKVTVAIGHCRHNPLAYAESALQEAKLSYWKDGIPVRNDRSDPAQNFHIIEYVRRILHNDELTPHIQKVVHTDNPDNLAFYEALVRFNTDDPDGWSPGQILPLIKRTQYYPLLTIQMMAKALDIARRFNVMVSVNLSIQDILNPATAKQLLTLLDQAQGQRIIVELTESEAITDFTPVKAFVAKLKEMKVQFAIDDFGNGYSNFAYLTELQPDIIKIDGSIIKNIEQQPHHVQVLRAIIFLATQLQVKTVAEFVETENCLTLLRELGVDLAQGFFIGRPALP